MGIRLIRGRIKALSMDIQVVFKNTIFCVCENHKQYIQVMVRRGPQCLNTVHGRTVPRQGNDMAIGHSNRGTEGSSNALADSSAAASKKIFRVYPSKRPIYIRRSGDRLIDDDDVVGKNAG